MDAAEELREFYNYLWGEEPTGDNPTYVYVPVEHDGTWTPFMFAWPRQREGVIRHTLKWSAIKANVFFSPALYKAARPIKENVLGVGCCGLTLTVTLHKNGQTSTYPDQH